MTIWFPSAPGAPGDDRQEDLAELARRKAIRQAAQTQAVLAETAQRFAKEAAERSDAASRQAQFVFMGQVKTALWDAARSRLEVGEAASSEVPEEERPVAPETRKAEAAPPPVPPRGPLARATAELLHMLECRLPTKPAPSAELTPSDNAPASPDPFELAHAQEATAASDVATARAAVERQRFEARLAYVEAFYADGLQTSQEQQLFNVALAQARYMHADQQAVVPFPAPTAAVEPHQDVPPGEVPAPADTTATTDKTLDESAPQRIDEPDELIEAGPEDLEEAPVEAFATQVCQAIENGVPPSALLAQIASLLPSARAVPQPGARSAVDAAHGVSSGPAEADLEHSPSHAMLQSAVMQLPADDARRSVLKRLMDAPEHAQLAETTAQRHMDEQKSDTLPLATIRSV